MHLDVILFRKTTVSLLDTYITCLRIVFDIFHRQLPPGGINGSENCTKLTCHGDKLILVVDELVDLQDVRLRGDEIGHLVIADRVHEALGLHFYFQASRSSEAIGFQI